jgi:glycosyltransferase involved in cell wall biosynthesis
MATSASDTFSPSSLLSDGLHCRVRPDVTIRTALQQIEDSEQRLALVISGDDDLRGAVTDGDLRRGLRDGLSPEQPVTAVMIEDRAVARREGDPENIVSTNKENEDQQVPFIDEGGHVPGSVSSKTPRLAIVSTHPIQYYAPYFRQLSAREGLDVRVFYGWEGPSTGDYDPGFDEEVTWDIPLLDGYPHTFLENESDDPGTHHFRGIVTPDLVPSIEAWGADAVLVYGWNYWSHLAALRHFHGRVPVLFRGDSTLLDETPGPRQWARRLALRWVYRHVDRALYVGQNSRAYFEAHGLSDDQLTWVPHAVENARFADAPDAEAKARRWREKIGIPEEAPVVLFAGKLGEKKAPDVLLDAFLQLEKQEAHLAVVGSGPMEEALRDEAEDHPRVHFLGFQNQSRMPVVYRLGDVFVLPSRGPGETWGLAVNEAMACGRPVVVTEKVGCAPDLVDDANGRVVPAEEADALAVALDDLLAERGRLRALGRRSAERIRYWSIDTAADRTVDVVRSAVGVEDVEREPFIGPSMNTRETENIPRVQTTPNG